MKELRLNECNARLFDEKMQNAVIIKIRNIFDLEGVDLSHINDALWDSKLRILYTSDLTIIRFNQKSFKLFIENLITYQDK